MTLVEGLKTLAPQAVKFDVVSILGTTSQTSPRHMSCYNTQWVPFQGGLS